MNDWYTVSAVAVAGLILGALFIYIQRRRNAPKIGGVVDLERKDLEAKRDALVLQLRDSSLGVDERARLENEAADAMRKLDEYGPAHDVASTSAAAEPLAMNASIKGFLWGAASVGALAALGYFVMQQAKPRAEGGSLTGGMESQAPPMQAANAQGTPQSDPMLQQLETAVRAQPNDLRLRNELAQAYFERNNLMAVFQETKFVLDQQPENSRALTLQAFVRVAMGEVDDAMQMMQRAAKNDPKNLDSWVGMALIEAQRGRMTEAEKLIDEAVRQAPQEEARLREILGQIQQQIAQGGAAPEGSALPEGHPPIGSEPAAAPASAPATAPASGPGVQVTLELDPGAKPRSGIVFVIARNPAGGPPVAVKRVVAASFPMNVELTSADSMMGQTLPQTFRIEARLDADGDPLTKPPTDPAGAQENVTPGAGIRLVLK